MNLRELQLEFQRTGELRDFRSYEKVGFKCFECGRELEETISAKELRQRVCGGKLKVCVECKAKQAGNAKRNERKRDEVIERLDRIEKLLTKHCA